MAQLLVFKWDHGHQSQPKPSVEAEAALPKSYDLVEWRSDDWVWGAQELAHSWLRLLSWVDANPAELDALMSPLLPLLDSNGDPTTYPQYRGFYPALQQLPWPNFGQFTAWWNSDRRGQSMYTVPPGLATVASITTARPHVPI